MQAILTVAIAVTFATSLFVLVAHGRRRLTGSAPSSLLAFSAILFTSGLDVGLIMFPLTEFPVYESEAAYAFTNPLAIEFGFWGFLVWGFYFLTTWYFCVLEPDLKLFDIGWVKAVNNIVIIATCAFTGYLFLTYLPSYVEGVTPAARYGLVALVVLLAVLSSTHIRYVKWLSFGSTALFGALIAVMWALSGLTPVGFAETAANIGGYFANLPRFLSPVTDYHAFYLFWWFAWSIMIGQFVARFVGGLSARQLFVALLVLPSIPIGLWFTVLYHVHAGDWAPAAAAKGLMVAVGVIFVVNSLDSLTRLYSENLGLTVERLGTAGYVAAHWTLLFGLVLLYQFTPLKIEWIGLVVIGIYAATYILVFQRRDRARALIRSDSPA